jgi:hypothetical protein
MAQGRKQAWQADFSEFAESSRKLCGAEEVMLPKKSAGTTGIDGPDTDSASGVSGR